MRDSAPAWRAAAAVLVIGFAAIRSFGQEPLKTDAPVEKPRTPAAVATPTEAKPHSDAPISSADTLRPGKITDPADLEAFFDGVFDVQLPSSHVAGATVAVVVGDKLVFRKGYGYADVETRRKVDPDKTLFRIASISKLFTWTAVMQQVEEGKLDLDTDVNTYLKGVQIPPAFDQPITLKNLLTHTPGFDDYVVGLFSRKPDRRPLAEILREQMPNRVRPPGELSCYSNHGTAMAGLAVACVSGMPWEEYVEKRILKPLGMEHTLTRQPDEADIPADMSTGYKWDGDHFAAKSFEYTPASPAGCMSTTADDAAKFMIAHLNDGTGNAGRILKPETARRMHEPLFRHEPKTSAMCYGFMEEFQNGRRLVGHGGDTLWFHSLLELIPEEHVGLFISYNTDTAGGGLRERLLGAFMSRYFPEPDPPAIAPPSDARAHARRVVGEYLNTRYSHTSIGKLAALLYTFDVTANDDGTITVSAGGRGRRFVEVQPRVYRDVDGTDTVVFREGADGRGRYLFLANSPPMSTIRPEWYESSIAQWSLFGVSAGLFATALVFWPAIAFSVRGLTSPRIRRTWFSGVLSCLAWLLSATSLAFVGGLLYALKDPNEIAFGLTPLLKALLIVTQVCAGLAAVTVLACLVAWYQRYWRFTGRLHYTLIALAGVGFTVFLYNWNLLPHTFGRM